MWNYTDKVFEHFKNPRNVGEIEKPDAVGEVGSVACGDALKLTLKIDKSTEKITDAKFLTFGCASAIASSSVLTEMIIGLTLAEASKITNQQIADALGGLPGKKMHCSVMGMEALGAAIDNYRGNKRGKIIVGGAEKVVCKCYGVTEAVILKAVRINNLHTVEEVTDYTKAGAGCGQCRGEIEKILKDYWAGAEHKSFSDMTTVQKIKVVEKVLSEDINPKLKTDGGWIELVDIKGFEVTLRFLGMCKGCPSSARTMVDIVEKTLKEKITPELIIRQAD